MPEVTEQIKALLDELESMFTVTMPMPDKTREALSGWISGKRECYQLAQQRVDFIERERLKLAAKRARRVAEDGGMSLEESKLEIRRLFKEAGLSRKE